MVHNKILWPKPDEFSKNFNQCINSLLYYVSEIESDITCDGSHLHIITVRHTHEIGILVLRERGVSRRERHQWHLGGGAHVRDEVRHNRCLRPHNGHHLLL